MLNIPFQHIDYKIWHEYSIIKSTEDITAILNTLSYINLLPEDELIIELRKMRSDLKNMLKGNKLSGDYKKLFNRI